MIDNFTLIRNFLKDEFEDGYFFFVQVYQRKKDHADRKVNGTNNNNRLIRPYFVNNIEYFDFIKPELIELAEVFKARVGIDLNKRSYEKIAFLTMKKVADQLLNRDYDKVYKAYSNVCGKNTHDSQKKWILDIDGEVLNDDDYKYIRTVLDKIQPIGNKIILRIPSLNGEHLITYPFNIKEADWMLKKFNIDIHKKNPTNLYIPTL